MTHITPIKLIINFIYIALHYVASFFTILIASPNYILQNEIHFMLILYLPKNYICRRDKYLDLDQLDFDRRLFQCEV